MINAATARLYWQLGWIRALLWIAGAGRTSEPTPEAHLYLADLHFKLAAEFEARGKRKAARRHRKIAERHASSGPPPEPGPKRAAAMAMPVPQDPIFTDARGKWMDDADD